MLALFLFISFGLLFGYFATLNTAPSTISIGSYIITVPIYIVVLVSLGLGVVISSLFYTFQSLSTRFTVGRKNRELNDLKKDAAQQLKTIHQLELENTKLKTKNGDESDDEDSI